MSTKFSKLFLPVLTAAVSAAFCAITAAQPASTAPQAQAAPSAVGPSAAMFVGPQLIAHLIAPAQLNFSPSNFSNATATPLVSSSSVAAAYSAALPSVSAQFESIFLVPCRAASPAGATSGPEVDSDSADGQREPCVKAPDPDKYSRFLNSSMPSPLTPAEKAFLAIHDVKDPGNLATIFSTSGFTVALNPRTAFGPGFAGFARASGYSLSEDATQEFFSTFVVSSLMHEDPRYHRMPAASVPRRLLHAVGHTFLSQSDSGRVMLNFAALSAYPISAELANLYVPGLQTDARSTADRIAIAYATDPVDNLITEFVPDLARHVHVRVIFAQRLLNQLSSDDFVLP